MSVPGTGARPADRLWWLKMTAASLALAVLLVGSVQLAPLLILHYHGFCYRHDHDRAESLYRVCDHARAHRTSRTAIVRLLGRPNLESADWLAYETGALMGTIDNDMTADAKAVSGPACVVIVLKDGRAEGLAEEILSPDRCARAAEAMRRTRSEDPTVLR